MQRIIASCTANLAEIGESLGDWLGGRYSVAAGDPSPLDRDAIAAELSAPGTCVALQADEQGILCLIPNSLGQPAADNPDEQNAFSRLDSLAGEWARIMLPPDLLGGEHAGLAVDNLADELVQSEPAGDAMVFPLQVTREKGAPQSGEGNSSAGAEQGDAEVSNESEETTADGDEPSAGDSASETTAMGHGTIYVIFPVLSPPLSIGPSWPTDELGSIVEAAAPHAARSAEARRIYNLPVQLAVRLAEKKISMDNLLGLAPGGLIVFNKSCEDLLDLYVNNVPFALGEAVKIGEKFGLKITDRSRPKKRRSGIL